MNEFFNKNSSHYGPSSLNKKSTKMPPKRKPLECVTGGSMTNTRDELPSTPIQSVKRRRGIPPKGMAPGASFSLFPGKSIAQFNIPKGVSTCRI